MDKSNTTILKVFYLLFLWFLTWNALKRDRKLYHAQWCLNWNFKNDFKNINFFSEFSINSMKNMKNQTNQRKFMDKFDSSFFLGIMLSNLTLRLPWFSADLTFYLWIQMNQYRNALTLVSGNTLRVCYWLSQVLYFLTTEIIDVYLRRVPQSVCNQS